MTEGSPPSVLRLFPGPTEQLPLHGLYLAHDLRRHTRDDRAFCFSNFVVSLDGRASVSTSPEEEPSGVPASLMSTHDWRLFQELMAQSDTVLVSGRYVRDVGTGRAEPLVQLDRPGLDDLQAWRRDGDMATAPDVVVVSASLDVEPDAARALGPRVVVATHETSSAKRHAALQDAGVEVVSAGSEGRVEGLRLVVVLAELGYRTVYAAAGPVTLHMLVESGVLDRLFITTVSRFLGGQRFSTMIEGDAFRAHTGMQLEALYLDSESHQEISQVFAAYRMVL